jgi:hypothetical protein
MMNKQKKLAAEAILTLYAIKNHTEIEYEDLRDLYLEGYYQGCGDTAVADYKSSKKGRFVRWLKRLIKKRTKSAESVHNAARFLH